MTPRATPAEVAQLEEAVNAIRSRAAHLHSIAEELEALIEEDVEDEEVVSMIVRLETLDQLLTGETSVDDASAGIPGLDQIMESLDELEIE